MALIVLSIGYPFAPVGARRGRRLGADTLGARPRLGRGGASLYRHCVRGVQVAGELVSVPAIPGPMHEDAMKPARRRYGDVINTTLQRRAIDLVHMHGLDFHNYLPQPGVPVLATLHLPAQFYPERSLEPATPNTWINAVSASQHRTFGNNPRLLPPIDNGVLVSPLPAPHAKREFALMLTRICPEKGVHLAIDAAKLAGIPLLIGGEVFPYSHHQDYFEREVVPRLDRFRRFMGPIGGGRKRRLLASARCVLIPSLIAETSSLVAREAIAAGTPVVAFKAGALVETVDDGRTGFLVDNVVDMAVAMQRVHSLSSEHCREVARRRFSLDRMVDAYFSVYRDIVDASAMGRLRVGVA